MGITYSNFEGCLRSETGDEALEKAEEAKKSAEEQMTQTTNAVSDAASKAHSRITDASKDAYDKIKDFKKQASEKVGEIEHSIEAQTDLAYQAETKAFYDIDTARDHAIEEAVEKFDEAKQESHTHGDLMKASAYITLEKELKAVGNAFKA